MRHCRKERFVGHTPIEDGFGTIPYYCFAETNQLREVDIPGSVTIISTCAFYKSGVRSVEFHTGTSIIKESAFEESGVGGIVLPPSVTNIGYAAFRNCESLATVKLHGNIMLGGETFCSCGNLSSVDMGLTDIIPNNCFANCNGLVDVKFVSGTSIGDTAFRSCGFTELNLLPYLQRQSSPTNFGGFYNIGSGAFANCKNLINVDDYEYRWNVGMIRKDRVVDKDGNAHWVETDLGLQVRGIYDVMGATIDSVFSGTGLKQIGDFPKPADTPNTRYILYHYVE